MALLRASGRAANRGPSLRRIMYFYARKGAAVAAKWPTTRVSQLTDKQKDAMERFRQANILTKYAAPVEQITALEATQGTVFYPRDVQIMAMYGRLFAIQEEGQRWTLPLAFKKDVSASLDTITPVEGRLIVRGADFWEALPPGDGGSVLISRGPGVEPEWLSLAAEEDDVMISSSGNTVAPGGALSTTGNLYRPALVCFVSHIWGVILTVDGAQYKASLFRMNGTTIAELIAQGPTIVAAGASQQAFVWPMNVVGTMLPGVDYAAVCTRIDATDATNNKLRAGSIEGQGFPSDVNVGTFFKADKDPQVGDPLSEDTNSKYYTIGLIYTI